MAIIGEFPIAGPSGDGTGDMLRQIYDPTGQNRDIFQYASLRNLGAAPRRNLLDNWYFVGGGSQQGGGQFPINQRGKTSYTGRGYGIDRWKWDVSDGLASIIIHDGYTTFQRNGWLRQIVESGRTTFDGKTMTASILTNEGELQTVTFVATANDSYTNTEWWMFNHYFNGHAWIFGFCAFNRDCNALAAKLELGSQQTLAYQDESGNWQLFETPDYGEELAKCQRYYLPIDNRGRFPAVFSSPSTTLQVFVPTPVTMRVNPTVQGITRISARVYSGAANSQSLSVSQTLLTEAGVLITFSVTWPTTLKPYSCAIVVFEQDGALSAEL